MVAGAGAAVICERTWGACSASASALLSVFVNFTFIPY